MLVSSLLVAEEDFDKELHHFDAIYTGVMYKGVLKRTSSPMPVAVWDPLQYWAGKLWQESLKDAATLANTKHPGILSPVGFCIDTSGPRPSMKYVLTPFMDNGSVLKHVIKEQKGERDPRWDATRKSMCVFGIAATMAYIHRLGILHTHLKLQNVLLNERFEPVISEAGLRKPILDWFGGHGEGSEWFYYVVRDEVPEDGQHRRKCRYDENDTAAGDVYTYGICLLRMIRDIDQWMQHHHMYRSWLSVFDDGIHYLMPPEESISDAYRELICRCCDPKPEDRPTFAQIVEELQRYPEEFAFPGTDFDALREYQDWILEGFEVDDHEPPR